MAADKTSVAAMAAMRPTIARCISIGRIMVAFKVAAMAITTAP